MFAGFDLDAWTASDVDHTNNLVNNSIFLPIKRDGDWTCNDCNNLNFAKRVKCNKCGASPPISNLNGREDLTYQSNNTTCNSFKKGDWICIHCGNSNWARRSKCNVCNSAKPTSTETPRTGRGGGHYDLQDPQDKELHISDDEEYDEFGRKKRRRNHTNTRNTHLPTTNKSENICQTNELNIILHYPLPPSCRSMSMSSVSSNSSDYIEEKEEEEKNYEDQVEKLNNYENNIEGPQSNNSSEHSNKSSSIDLEK